MYSVRVKKDLENRLDAEFYSPDALQAIDRIRGVGEVSTLGDEIVEGYRVVYHGTDSVANLGKNQKLGFLSPTQISSEGDIDFDGLDELPLYYKEQYPKGLAKAEELLVEVKGNVSKVTVIPSHFPQNLMISGSLYKATLSEKLDPHYALAFLKSKHGQLLKDRLTSNTIINYIGKDDLYSIPVLLAAPYAQKYIGDKVRQAERLRAWAKKLERVAREIFDADICWNDAILNVPRYSSLGASELEGRLDLKFNSPQRISIKRYFRSENIATSQLSELVEISAMIGWKGLTTEFYRDRGPWLLRGVEFNNGVINTDALVCIDEFKYSEQPQIHLRENDIAFSKDGTIGKACVIPKLTNRLAAGSTIARLRILDGLCLDPYYLDFAIGHPCVQVQIESFATGIAQPHITQEWIGQLELPRVSNEAAIANMWRNHHVALGAARNLIKVAKFLVEGLIEGSFSEEQLINAQKALDADDTSLDRGIFDQLTANGLDGDPLFPDLDQLYDLLAQSQSPDE